MTTPNAAPDRIRFFDTAIDLASMDELIARAEEAMATRKLMRHTAINVAKLVKLRKDSELAEDVNTSDIVGIDGQGIVYGLRLFGLKSATRVAGIDLFLGLLDHCARTGRKPFILGARQEALDEAIRVAKQNYPGLEFAGARNGYFTRDEHEEVVAEIASSGADCLFVAMPTPHKERFLRAYSERLNVPFIMGVGGSVDVLAGRISRAPAWMQKVGLEWFHRMVKEPRKMIGRYAQTNSVYAWLLTRALITGNNPIEPAR